MAILQKEELKDLINNRKYPEIKSGDSISIEMLPFVSSKTTEIIKGIVIGISNRGMDTLIRTLNVSHL